MFTQHQYSSDYNMHGCCFFGNVVYPRASVDMQIHNKVITVTVYVEDRYTTQAVLKPSERFYKGLAGFKTGWPDSFTPAVLKPTNAQSCSLLDRPARASFKRCGYRAGTGPQRTSLKSR